MRVLEKRLRRLEVGLLAPTETEESRRLHEVVLDIRRRRAARLGIPEPKYDPEHNWRCMSHADTILAARRRKGAQV